MPDIDWLKAAREYQVASGHSLLGPSTYPRLFRCNGSLRAIVETGARSKDTEYTIEGQRGHYLAELTLLDGDCRAEYFVGDTLSLPGKKPHTFVVSQEMADAVQEYVDWCQELPGEHYIEHRVKLSEFLPLPEQEGMADHMAVYYDEVWGWTLCGTDLKFGQGVKVYAARNEQIMAYILGFYLDVGWTYPIERVLVRVSQPRLQHHDVWECTLEDLLRFGDEVMHVATEAMGDNVRLVPGEKQCQFCPVSGQCKPQKQMNDAILAADFDAFDDAQKGKPVEMLTRDEMALVLGQLGFVKNWLSKVKLRAFELLMGDKEAIPDWKIVEGGSRRAYEDKVKAKKFLLQHLPKDEVFEVSLITPAQAEKKLRPDLRKEFADYLSKPPGKPTLAPRSDSRSVYQPLIDDLDAFDDDEADDLD